MTQLEIDGQFHRTHFWGFVLVAEGKKHINETRLCLQVGEADLLTAKLTQGGMSCIFMSNSNSALTEKVQRHVTSFNHEHLLRSLDR